MTKSMEGCRIISNNSISIKNKYQTLVPNPGVHLIWKQVSEIPSCSLPTGMMWNQEPLYSGMLVNNLRQPYIGHVDAENRVMVYSKDDAVQLEAAFFNILCTHELGVEG